MENEKRLIDANALLKIYKNWLPQLTAPEDKGDRQGVETCIAVLEDAPTVDAEEVAHGRWIVHHEGGNNWCECSECNTVGSPFWKRCPVCEAKMLVKGD